MYVAPIIEGPVEIHYEDSGGKQKVTFVIDFGETDLSPDEAVNVHKAIVTILRKKLGVCLSRCAEEE